MPPAGQATASLALWLHLKRRATRGPIAPQDFAQPPGAGPLLFVHVSESGDVLPQAEALIRTLHALRPGTRFVFTGAAPSAAALPSAMRAVRHKLPEDGAGAESLIAALNPVALLIVGDQLPAAMITTMAREGRPVLLSEARLAAHGGGGFWRGMVNRGLISQISHIMAPDPTAGAAAQQLGADPDRIEMTGPVTETLPPPAVNEAERGALAQILRGRHIWMAAAPSMSEIRSILVAHQSALHHNHRALLILAGLPEAAIPEIRAEAEALGLAAVLRSEDDDPQSDDHVLIAEDPYEMGLWYRLASVCFMGGTLSPGRALAPRHPFEPAALGSAIIHGPLPGPFSAEWAQLDGSSAARLVLDGEALSRAVADLSAPDQAAMLAGNAWSVSTGGAAVLRRIADTVIAAMESEP
ncbi:glycosyltransferase N-terminal domain-containing protein [Paracoccus sp. MBLB3053]|uniref:3-deoxy-D-manno-octulosonic acid transferase n=1 Tax=Paracoccus aurantius TaxID=3073814 RepID=A0ABU2HMP2_9RHOB|nr:glycosyltransferase N-terminal domain-containing protein [Paracoccus sp. MBLB3053]MDS9466296.1 glycosyltransferase N-terminal domain-containing protein [Paracoccus sp. MBLB3053]